MKAERITAEIEKTKAKIADLRARLGELERQKTEQENTEIIELMRAIEAPPQEVAVMLRALLESQRQQAMASLAPQVEDNIAAGYEKENVDDEE